MLRRSLLFRSIFTIMWALVPSLFAMENSHEPGSSPTAAPENTTPQEVHEQTPLIHLIQSAPQKRDRCFSSLEDSDEEEASIK